MKSNLMICVLLHMLSIATLQTAQDEKSAQALEFPLHLEIPLIHPTRGHLMGLDGKPSIIVIDLKDESDLCRYTERLEVQTKVIGALEPALTLKALRDIISSNGLQDVYEKWKSDNPKTWALPAQGKR